MPRYDGFQPSASRRPSKCVSSPNTRPAILLIPVAANFRASRSRSDRDERRIAESDEPEVAVPDVPRPRSGAHDLGAKPVAGAEYAEGGERHRELLGRGRKERETRVRRVHGLAGPEVDGDGSRPRRGSMPGAFSARASATSRSALARHGDVDPVPAGTATATTSVATATRVRLTSELCSATRRRRPGR